MDEFEASKDDRRRHRELLRYLLQDDLAVDEPPSFRRENGFSQSIFSAVQPYCQLTALRCNVPKVMLNVMDIDKMYFLSQASSGLESPQLAEDPVLQACSDAVPLAGRVCELTIRMAPGEGAPAIFTVPDLSQSRFRDLSIVKGPPYYRFYAGTPITTVSGINIGSLAVLDTEIRQSLTPTQEAFLGRTAAQIMDLLETRHRALKGRRATLLGRSLEAFTAGLTTTSVARAPPKSYGVHSDTRNAQDHVDSSASPTKGRTTGLDRLESARNTAVPDRLIEQDPLSEQSIPRTFQRAADLLHEAFDRAGENVEVAFASLDNIKMSPPYQDQWPSRSGINSSRRPSERQQSAFVARSQRSDHSESNLPRHLVASLIQDYPKGCLIDVDDNSCQSPGSDGSDPGFQSDTDKTSGRTKTSLIEGLQAAFPSARQVLFTPLWHSDRGSYAFAAFVVNSDPAPSLSTSPDLSFLNAFCCCLMSECSRIDAAKSQKQKSDFVGTMSHEMRSPLHGILASVEFLSETSLETYQRSLLRTVQSCGRTLLDTINHVLDFSKINTYQKSWQANNRRTDGLRKKISQPPDATAPALIQLTDVVEIAVVVEEVIDTLVTGGGFTPPAEGAKLEGENGYRNPLKKDDSVQIFLDVQVADWEFVAQPGAVRRIVMNIVGNAMKYTTEGTIAVQLEQRTSDDEVAMILTVTDTGCGMSKHFVDSKLFVPFSQENVLVPGTGLGLSIVQSIITILGGTIDVTSKPGDGTSIQVILPLQRPFPSQKLSNTSPQSGSSFSSQSGPQVPVEFLRSQTTHRRVALSIANQKLKASVHSFITQWYGLQIADGEADIYIVDEEERSTPKETPGVVLLLANLALQHDLRSRLERAEIDMVSTPVGPYRLARSICTAIARHDAKPEFLEACTSPQPLAQKDHNQKILDKLRELDLGNKTSHDLSFVVQSTETVSFSQTSAQAQKIIHSPTIERSTLLQNSTEGFPFRPQERVPSHSVPATAAETPAHKPTTDAATTSPPNPPQTPRRKPRVLVVDDNRINLQLLSSFLTRKRQYTDIACAEEGQQALDAFTSATTPYDIVFMDISMPVMNGFETTRAIRAFEEAQGSGGGGGGGSGSTTVDTASGDGGALIIALTGLAGGRDQAEAFSAGVDVYITKPVSFKVVAELLDNWENQSKLKGPLDS